MSEIITKDSPRIRVCFETLERLELKLEHLSESSRPPLNGERFLTDAEVSDRLKISRRTLQDYRNNGRIAYIQLGRGKILYRESDIEAMLQKHHQKAWE